MAEPRLFIGIDGGGSRCRVRIRDARRHLLGAGEAGAANMSLDFDGAVRTIRAVVASALDDAGFDWPVISDAAIGLGLAGVSTPAVGDRVRAALGGFARVAVGHDGLAACLGAHAGRDGGLVIAGTGSAAVLWQDGRSVNLGGRGFLLGDDGSGAWIGKAIWRLALRAHDGFEPSTPLLAQLLGTFDHDLARVIAWARNAPSHAFAAYAPQVFEAAGRGDPMAAKVVVAAAASIGELIDALTARGAPRISLVGGIAAAIAPHLQPTTRGRLAPPLADALEGALLMAGLPLAV